MQQTELLFRSPAMYQRKAKNDMLPSTVLQNTYQNDMYTVSFNEAVSLFYYNKDVFEEHGFRIPEGIDDAYTLDEVYEMAKEVSTPECRY